MCFPYMKTDEMFPRLLIFSEDAMPGIRVTRNKADLLIGGESSGHKKLLIIYANLEKSNEK